MTLRRDFLAFTAGAVAARKVLPAAADAAPVHPDAELIGVCAEFDECGRRIGVILGDGPGSISDDKEADAATAPFHARMEVLLGRMDELRATTPGGIQARAHSLAQHSGHGSYSFDYETDPTGRMLRMLLRDSAALGGSPPCVVASPDADLLQACAAFDALERAFDATGFYHEPGSSGQAAAKAEQRRICRAQDPLVAHICELRAVTREGLAARARSLALWDKEMMNEGSSDTGACLTAAIVRDLIG